MPFYILLFLYLAPVCLALYWLTKLVVWIIKKVFHLSSTYKCNFLGADNKQ